MTHVVTHACVGVKDKSCTDVCPVDCIYGSSDPDSSRVHIHPEECIDCGLCIDACPVEAIFHEEEVPPTYRDKLLNEAAEYLSIPRQDAPASNATTPSEDEERFRVLREEREAESRRRLDIVDQINSVPLSSLPTETTSQLAYFFPDYSPSRSYILNSLLFFDGIAILVPRQRQPDLFGPFSMLEELADLGVLRIIDPGQVVDRQVTQELALAVKRALSEDLLASPQERATRLFTTVSILRMGYGGSTELARWIHNELVIRDLAVQGVSDRGEIAIDAEAFELLLYILAQILCSRPLVPNASLHPITDRRLAIQRLDQAAQFTRKVNSTNLISDLITTDSQVVGIDVSDFPLDEILDFRREHASDYRIYMRSVREAARYIALLPAEERSRALRDRQEELHDLAADLRSVSRTAWRRAANLLLSFAGAFWSGYSGDPVAGVLAASGSIISDLTTPPSIEGGIYSYLLEAPRSLNGIDY